MTDINSSYKISRTLHWLCAFTYVFLVISMPIALDYAKSSADRRLAHDIHQSVATLFSLLLIIRFSWIAYSKDTGLRTVFENKLQHFMARINHTLLYFLMISTPITGFFYKLTSGKPVSFFGFELIPMSEFLSNGDWEYYLEETHFFIIDLFYLLIFLHIAGALLHFAKHFKSEKK